ncbi:zinc-dependent alcohol dehydrogenase family protein [Chitinimonas naiadis]
MSATATMQALVLEQHAAPLQLRTIARPTPGRGEVLVRIHASGINPLDTKIRAGKADHAQQPLQSVLGIDLAGVVDTVGEGVVGFQPGDAVYGMTGGVAGLQGSLADYAAVDAQLLAHKPANFTMREAAALPLVFITAWEGLVDRANVHAGQKVLIHGGTGGIGHVAVQLAKARGAEVYATVSPGQMETVRALGATPIDYTSTTVADYVAQHTDGEGFDIVFDTVGGATLDDSFVAARTYGGHVLSALGWGTHKLAPLSFRAATYSGVFTLRPMLTGKGRANHGHILREATKLAEAGKLRLLLDPRRFSLDTAMEAHALIETGKAQGKLVVEIVT